MTTGPEPRIRTDAGLEPSGIVDDLGVRLGGIEPDLVSADGLLPPDPRPTVRGVGGVSELGWIVDVNKESGGWIKPVSACDPGDGLADRTASAPPHQHLGPQRAIRHRRSRARPVRQDR